MATRKNASAPTRKSATKSTKPAAKPASKSASTAGRKPPVRSAAPRSRSGSPTTRSKVSRGAPTRASGADGGTPAARQSDGEKAAATLALAKRAAQVCVDNKANEVVLLSLKGVTDMTDYFVIASGTSDTHVRSLGEHVVEELKKDGAPATSVEGLQSGRWVLLDYVDFVVHLFHPTLRGFYQLERLWSDAEVVPLPEAGATA